MEENREEDIQEEQIDLDDLNEEDEEDNTEKLYYCGRILRMPQWRIAYEDVLLKLKKHTVLVFLMWFYDLVNYLNQPHTKLPG